MTPSPRARLALFVLAGLAAPLAAAVPLSPQQVPEPLKAWTAWALRGHEEAACPVLPGDDEGTVACAWPSKLELSLEAKSGRFTQAWHAFIATQVPLPGDLKRWPQDVRVDGQPASTLPGEDGPSLHLAPGDHVITGTFAWDGLPESLAVPGATGLLTLTLAGRAVAQPSRDASGLLWLQGEAASAQEEARLDVTVHRLVADEVPLLVTTRVRLDVSGRSREVLLASPLLKAFLPISLTSQLPARLDPDGRLRVQVRPGTWLVDVVARHDGPVAALTLEKTQALWAQQELWVFDARPELRVTQVEGPQPVDPQQTTLPDEWRQLPAYRMLGGETMKLVEIRRGDADPAPDRLALTRTFWLDFDGGGWTVQDQLSGQLTRSWRLNMQEKPTALGRVSVAGRDQLVTRLQDGPAGVEVRQGAVNLSADSRIDAGLRTLPAVGWDHDFNSLGATLQLPPGWRLVHAGGVDDVPETWVHRWTLLDFFLVLVIAVAVSRLFGNAWGALALVTLVLTFPESGAPRVLWLFALALEALVRVLRTWRFAWLVRTARTASWIVLALVIIPFAVQHVRLGMYPTLERAWGTIGDGSHGGAVAQTIFADDVDPVGNLVGALGSLEEGSMGGARMNSYVSAPKKEDKSRAKRLLSLDDIASENAAGSVAYQQRLDLVQNDPKAMVQTGPGLPAWTWQQIALRWNGPVEKGQEISLLLVPPGLNLVLAFLRVLLVALLLLRIVRASESTPLPTPGAPLVAALLLALVALPAQALEMPSEETLEQLREALLEKPACHPDCAASPRLFVDADGRTLRLRQEFGVQAPTAVPLPGGLEHWVPERVLVDGQPAKALRRSEDGNLWLALPAGVHQVLLEGALPDREAVQIPLPMKPYRVEAKATGWTVDGIGEGGSAEDTLQLSRVKREGDEAAARTQGLEPGALPPFVRVERALLLGLDWTLETRVTRLTPSGAPVVIEVPLVEGESVMSDEVRAEGRKAIVNMGPRVNDVSWKSVVARGAVLTLTAPEGVAWTEVWRLEVSPVWHAEWSGVPAVLAEPGAQARIPEWRPWPGEQLTIRITPPTAVPGQTRTIQSSTLDVTPGLRATDATLTLVLSSSRGDQHVVKLPEGALLQSVTLDGRTLPLRQEGNEVRLPTRPGRQTAVLMWREPAGITTLFRTPAVDVGLPSVNTHVNLQLSPERWLLLAGGPHVGPAVLFWSLLLVLLAVSLVLARLRFAPLRTHQWVLLALGLTQVPIAAAAAVAAWLVLLGWRRARGAAVKNRFVFDLLQLSLVGLTFVALGVLFASIRQGLLGTPEMQIEGNGSTATLLHWFQDRTDQTLPAAWVVSVPRLVYRGLMLAWALWIALSLVQWLRWGFGSLVEGGGWRRLGIFDGHKPKPAPAPVAPPPLPKGP